MEGVGGFGCWEMILFVCMGELILSQLLGETLYNLNAIIPIQ